MMRCFYEANLRYDKKKGVWTLVPMPDFLRVNDMTAASIYVMQLDNETYQASTENMLSHINVGTGVDCTIRELAETLKKVVGFEVELTFDVKKPDSTARKLMDVSRIKYLGWVSTIALEEGLAKTYRWYIESINRT